MYVSQLLIALAVGAISSFVSCTHPSRSSGSIETLMTTGDSCAKLTVPTVLAAPTRVEVTAGGDLMPAVERLVGSIRLWIPEGQELPKDLVVDSAWLSGAGRTMGFRVQPSPDAFARADPSFVRLTYSFEEIVEYLGPEAVGWLWALMDSTGDLRFRVLWGRDTAYVNASECKLHFSM
jgi:hypothetical protein